MCVVEKKMICCIFYLLVIPIFFCDKIIIKIEKNEKYFVEGFLRIEIIKKSKKFCVLCDKNLKESDANKICSLAGYDSHKSFHISKTYKDTKNCLFLVQTGDCCSLYVYYIVT